MAFRRDFDLDMEKVAAYLKDAVSKVEANPEYYEELRKVFKQNVGFFRRSWVAAFLLKAASGAISHFNPNRKPREDFRSNRENRVSRYESSENKSNESSEPKERAPRIEIPEDMATTIFVNIGKNRKVYPRDIVGMITNVAGIERERIGEIRILASYSFVQLFKEDGDKVIAALNEYEYRGRKLSVNYSREKNKDAAETTESSASEEVFTESIPSDVKNTTAPHVDSYTSTTADTMAQQAAYAKQMAEMSDEEILAARQPRSSSTADIQ